jgi:argininosuccinate lyase
MPDLNFKDAAIVDLIVKKISARETAHADNMMARLEEIFKELQKDRQDFERTAEDIHRRLDSPPCPTCGKPRG